MLDSFWFGGNESSSLQTIAAGLNGSDLFAAEAISTFDTALMLGQAAGYATAYEFMRHAYRLPEYVRIDDAFSPFPCPIVVQSGLCEIGQSEEWPHRTWLISFHPNKGVFTSLYVIVDLKESVIGLFANHKLLAAVPCSKPRFTGDMLKGLGGGMTCSGRDAFAENLNSVLDIRYANVNDICRSRKIPLRINRR